jgi:signal transduction histidine kinase
MENKNEQDLRCLQLRFVGKILAGFTHEIKNHLAIVKESVGLMGDMIKLEKSGKDKAGQYLDIIRSIEEQIERSIGHFSYLNRFAHRMDLPLTKVNVNECMEELIALMHRFANQKRISLEKEFQKDPPVIQSNPAMLQLLVFNSLEEKLESLDKNSMILVKTEALNNSIAIRIIPKGNILNIDAEKVPYSQEINDDLIKMLGGTLSKGPDGEIAITVPPQMPC